MEAESRGDLIALVRADSTAHRLGRRVKFRLVHVYLGNARYNCAGLVKEWLAMPMRRIILYVVQTYCLQLRPIEQL